jgi:hypothetical protein
MHVIHITHRTYTHLGPHALLGPSGEVVRKIIGKAEIGRADITWALHPQGVIPDRVTRLTGSGMMVKDQRPAITQHVNVSISCITASIETLWSTTPSIERVLAVVTDISGTGGIFAIAPMKIHMSVTGFSCRNHPTHRAVLLVIIPGGTMVIMLDHILPIWQIWIDVLAVWLFGTFIPYS